MDILFATGNALSRSTVLNRCRGYHGNATEHSEQSEVDGTHASVTAYRTVRKGKMQRKNCGIYVRIERVLCVAEQNLEGVVKTR